MYSLGGMVSGLTGSGLVLSNAGSALAVSGNGDFTFPAPIPSGANYTVTVGTQPTPPSSSVLPQTCIVSSGTGTVANSSIATVEVICVNNAARFLYLTNGGSNNVSVYSIDTKTGALSQPSGSPYAAGTRPIALTIHPSGNFAYVSNAGANSISAYSIDSGTGVLAATTGSPIAVTPYDSTLGESITPVTFDPSGQFAIVGNPNATFVASGANQTQPDNLDVYSIDTSTGSLTPVSGSPFTTGALYPRIIAVDPRDEFIYAVNYPYGPAADESALSAYHIDGSTKALSPVGGSPFHPLTRQPTSFIISPSGNYAYLTNGSDQSIQWFAIDPTTGSFTAPNGSIPAVTASAPVLVSSGQFLYAADTVNGGLEAFSIDGATGTPTAIDGSPYTAGVPSASVTIDPANKYLYVASPKTTSILSGGNKIFAFNIDPETGVLSPVAGSPFVAASSSDTISAHFVIEPSGRFAYLPSATTNVIYAFRIDPSSGALAAVPGSPFPSGTAPGVPVFLYY